MNPYDEHDDYEDEIDGPTEEELDEAISGSIPQLGMGIFKMNRLPAFMEDIFSSISDIGHPNSRDRNVTLFNQEWIVTLLETGNERLPTVLECTRNPKALTTKVNSIEVYDFLEKSHFINYYLAHFIDRQIWFDSGLTMHLAITDKGEKITIIVNPSVEAPEFIDDINVFDYTSEEVSETFTSNDGVSTYMLLMKKQRHLFGPHIKYTINLISTSMTGIAKSLSHYHMYDACIDGLITEARNHLHCLVTDEITEKIVSTRIFIEESENVKTIEIDVMPSKMRINDEWVPHEVLSHTEGFINIDIDPNNNEEYSWINQSIAHQLAFMKSTPITHTVIRTVSIDNRMEYGGKQGFIYSSIPVFITNSRVYGTPLIDVFPKPTIEDLAQPLETLILYREINLPTDPKTRLWLINPVCSMIASILPSTSLGIILGLISFDTDEFNEKYKSVESFYEDFDTRKVFVNLPELPIEDPNIVLRLSYFDKTILRFNIILENPLEFRDLKMLYANNKKVNHSPNAHNANLLKSLFKFKKNEEE